MESKENKGVAADCENIMDYKAEYRETRAQLLRLQEENYELKIALRSLAKIIVNVKVL